MCSQAHLLAEACCSSQGAEQLTIWRPVLPVFPRAQSASFLISILISFQGLLKVSSCSGLWLSPYRGRWHVPIFSWHPWALARKGDWLCPVTPVSCPRSHPTGGACQGVFTFLHRWHLYSIPLNMEVKGRGGGRGKKDKGRTRETEWVREGENERVT